MMVRKTILMLLFVCSVVNLYGQRIAIKNNILYDAVAAPNIGVELSLNDKITLDISSNYNPISYGEKSKWKHWLIQPEARYWFCETFGGSFVGLHAFAGEFNLAGLKALDLQDTRVQGSAFGAGVSYGYHFILSPRWGVEANIGVGYARYSYDKYVCEHCGLKTGNYTKNYYGPTKAGLSLIYMLK